MRKVLSAVIIGLILGAGPTLRAQEQPQTTAIQKPKFGLELSKLSFLVGTFTTENMMAATPAGPGGPGKGRSMNRWDLDSIFLVFNYESNLALMKNYKGKAMLTYDVNARRYKCWWFDNYGQNSAYTGGFIGDTLTMETEPQTIASDTTMMPEASLKEKLMWHKEGNKFMFRLLWDWGEGYNLVMEETATPSVSPVKPGLKK